ncbi:hypothetical protein [Methylomonas albis]|nr:hypothetical protein [Methylomonas albis]
MYFPFRLELGDYIQPARLKQGKHFREYLIRFATLLIWQDYPDKTFDPYYGQRLYSKPSIPTLLAIRMPFRNTLIF